MGKLYIVPTPVGNMEDITLRALRLLREVDVVLAEDTRTSSCLLRHYDISTHLIAHHKWNEHTATASVIERLRGGQTIALVSDAGTPGISDPGFFLVREAVREGQDVECLPGPTAFVPALVASGLPSDHFVFEGFLPVKKGRQTRLNFLAQETRTMIIYESPYRLARTLTQLAEAFGPDRPACVSREISKIHEEHARGTLQELAQRYTETPPKGEIVLIVGGKDKEEARSENRVE